MQHHASASIKLQVFIFNGSCNPNRRVGCAFSNYPGFNFQYLCSMNDTQPCQRLHQRPSPRENSGSADSSGSIIISSSSICVLIQWIRNVPNHFASITPMCPGGRTTGAHVSPFMLRIHPACGQYPVTFSRCLRYRLPLANRMPRPDLQLNLMI